MWVPEIHHFKIPLAGDPTRPDRPGDMYDAETVGAEKDLGPATGVAINGINIQVKRTELDRYKNLLTSTKCCSQGPNDAGDVSIDEAGFQLACGGHVTPPTENIQAPPPAPAGTPPLYHYHKVFASTFPGQL